MEGGLFSGGEVDGGVPSRLVRRVRRRCGRDSEGLQGRPPARTHHRPRSPRQDRRHRHRGRNPCHPSPKGANLLYGPLRRQGPLRRPAPRPPPPAPPPPPEATTATCSRRRTRAASSVRPPCASP